jgi:hypothetical protein
MKPWTVRRIKRPCAPGTEGKWCVYAYHSAGVSFWLYDTRREALAVAREHNRGMQLELAFVHSRRGPH